MFGENFPQRVKELLSSVPMNALEKGLMEKYLQDFDNISENVTKLAKIMLKNYGEDSKTAKKELEKVIALFEKHEFWST
jgi:hypothetical protein